uniref:Uncharacterized protein n=1 Tax=Lotharella vacuolata TaxID=74820 RepID=A0A0H5BL88_9EUKA|nr:hypothetical protein [Lotharella vacuolata]BAS01683.1 hypothetical protein [Lotharella vacuolata]
MMASFINEENFLMIKNNTKLVLKNTHGLIKKYKIIKQYETIMKPRVLLISKNILLLNINKI